MLMGMAAVLFFSCGGKDKLPSNVLPTDKMREVLWDVMRTDQFLTDYVFTRDSSLNKDQTSIDYYRRIFASHGITREQFSTSFAYYKKHPEYLKTVMDSIASRPELEPAELYKPKLADSIVKRQAESSILKHDSGIKKIIPRKLQLQ